MRAARPTGAAAWVVGVTAAAMALRWAGRGALSPPPLSDPGQWAGWLEARGAIVAAFSLLRVFALGGLWYVVAVMAIGAALRVAGAASLVRVADRFTIGPVRRMLAGTVSLGLAASGAVAVAAPALRTPVAAAQTSTTSTTRPPPATVTMHRLGPAEVAGPGPQAVATVPEVAPAARSDRWTVKPGECFWSIAQSVLAERLGRPPTDAEIVPYWLRLIDANRLELAERGNPDLIFPAQVFTIPSP